MQITKSKTAAITIAIFLTLSISASMMLIPTTSAHTPAWQLPTFAYIFVAPNPVGVGQSSVVLVWLDKVFDSAAFVNDYRFHNYKVTITKPDGTTETKTWDVVQDSTSSQQFSFTPDQVGTYIFNFTFPGQAVNTYSHNPASLAVNDTYLPSSASTTLTVQQKAVGNYPDSYPLPTQYWTRPIYGENSYWWSISSNWMGTGSPQVSQAPSRYLSDGVGSQTAHIMWTKPLQSGGVVGDNRFPIAGNTYFEGSAYISRYSNPIIVAGMLIYKEPIGFSSAAGGPTDCVDLRTGALIWSRTDVPSLSFAIIYDTEQANQHGVMQPVLCTASFARCFDANTGDPMYNFTGVPTGTAVLGPDGEQLRYVVTNCGTSAAPDWYLSEWNSSKIFFAGGLSPTQSGLYIVNGSNCYDWNVSIPWLNVMGNQTVTTVKYADGTAAIVSGYSATGTNPDASNPSAQLFAFYGNCIICRNGTLPGIGSSSSAIASSWSPYTYFAVNINASLGTLGSVRWWNTLQPPGNVTVLGGNADPTVGVFTETYKETMQWVGYSIATGQKLWGPSAPQADLDYYGYFFPGITGVPAYGKLYSSGMAGILYCYDMATGNLLWTYGNGGSGNSTNSDFQVPGPYPTFIYAIANGIIYTMDTEHTAETPIYKGAEARAINATDGTEIWTLSAYTGGGTSAAAMADGFNTWFNGYDDQIYVVGRGPSATTVTAPDTGLSFGTSVVIKGTVIDTSSGTTQDQQAADFPNGVACASDASMTDWMGYVYQQKPLPTNFTGVPVSIDVLDSNGNYRNIGTATTDASGTYRLAWTPDISGNYTVIATFHGTNGYWPSYAEDGFNVMAEPAATASPTPTPASMADLYFLPVSIAIIIAIVIVGAVLALLMLRKRP